VILFDEIEKAHRMFNILLQISTTAVSRFTGAVGTSDTY